MSTEKCPSLQARLHIFRCVATNSESSDAADRVDRADRGVLRTLTNLSAHFCTLLQPRAL